MTDKKNCRDCIYSDESDKNYVGVLCQLKRKYVFYICSEFIDIESENEDKKLNEE